MKKIVKTVREYQDNHEMFGDNSGQEFLSRETTYNPQGKAISTTSYLRANYPEQRVINEYDNKGRLVLETVEYLVDGLSEKQAFVYDEKDRITENKKLYEDGTFDLTSHIYDDTTHTTHSRIVDADGSLVTTQETLHDANGNVLKLIVRDADGNETYREEFTYNEKNKPVHHIVTDHDSGQAAGAVYIYNELGFLQQVKRLNEKGNQVSNEQFTTDEHGNVLSVMEEDHLHGTSHLQYESQYDEHNRVTLTVFYTEAGVPKRKDSYVYDEDGRVTEESHFLMNVARGSNEHYTRRFEYEFYT